MHGYGRCTNVDCVQVNCERLLEQHNGIYDFAKICGEDYKWFEGKDKIKVDKLEVEPTEEINE